MDKKNLVKKICFRIAENEIKVKRYVEANRNQFKCDRCEQTSGARTHGLIDATNEESEFLNSLLDEVLQ